MGRYKIVYNSVMLAMDHDAVVHAFAKLFNLTPDKAAAILKQSKTVLRSGLDAVAAEQYREKLMAIGVDVDVVDASRPQAIRSVLPLHTTLPDTALAVLKDAPVGINSITRHYSNQETGFVFTGSALAYSKIGLLNLMLNLLTLGIYSPWGSVRAQCYLLGATQLAGESFHCAAHSGQILQQRLVMLVLLLAAAGATWLPGDIRVLVWCVCALLSPLLLLMYLTARRRRLVWCGVNLGFERDIGGAYAAAALPLVLGGLLVVRDALGEMAAIGVLLLCVLLLPYCVYAVTRFTVTRTRYGNAFFGFSPAVIDYYRLLLLKLPAVALLALGLPVAAVALSGTSQAVVLIGILSSAASGQDMVWPASLSAWWLPLLQGGALLLGGLTVLAYSRAGLFNLRYHGVTLGKSYLKSDMRTGPLLQLWLGNMVAIVLSGGLLIPWAVLRMVRYRLSCLTVYISYELDDIIRDAQRDNAAEGVQ